MLLVLMFLQAAISISNSEGDPVEAIQISKCVQKFKDTLSENPHFLQEKVQHYFIVSVKIIFMSTPPPQGVGVDILFYICPRQCQRQRHTNY